MVCAAHFVPAQTTPIGAMQVTRTLARRCALCHWVEGFFLPDKE